MLFNEIIVKIITGSLYFSLFSGVESLRFLFTKMEGEWFWDYFRIEPAWTPQGQD